MKTPTFNKKSLDKPDGRYLHLYSWDAIADNIIATAPKVENTSAPSHLRWHPLRSEWVAYASHRQNRTFLPPKEFNPLAPTKSPDFPTELPKGDYKVAVFENLFASLSKHGSESPDLIVPTQAGRGVCEVVVFTQESETSLGKLPIHDIELLLHVWKDRYAEIQKDSEIKYVLPFENRGVEVGVTLHHPHGQIYAYPFIPPVPLKMYESQKSFWDLNHKTLLTDMIESEIRDGKRIIHSGTQSLAFIPSCARYPYEVWIAPIRPVSSLTEMTNEEIFDLALTLKLVLQKYDGMWNRPFPYLMVLYAAPNDQAPHPEWHFHIEFYPPYRSRDRLKFLAGTELGAGMFVNDSLPEDKAAELRNVAIEVKDELSLL